MASILDRYGIKEVCDFTFYTIDDTTGKPSAPALYLDTLKVSTVEQTADLVEAKGGKGNVTLLSWDTNKALNVTLEDALFSAKSLAIMFGNGSLKSYTGDTAYIMKTEVFTASGTESGTGIAAKAKSVGWKDKFEGPDGDLYDKRNPKFYNADGTEATAFVDGSSYFCSYDLKVTGSVVEISANSFPGTYYCVGDTYARNAKSGRNEFFQLIIPKAKVQSQNTITMQAEGDPSTFNMSLKVMKPDDGIMMKLVKYDAVEGTPAGAESSIASIDHNHVLATALPLLKSIEKSTGTFTEAVTVTGVTSSSSTTIVPSTSDITVACTTDTVTVTASGADAGLYEVTVVGKGTIDVLIKE